MKELKAEREMSRDEVAAYFRAFADQLASTDRSAEERPDDRRSDVDDDRRTTDVGSGTRPADDRSGTGQTDAESGRRTADAEPDRPTTDDGADRRSEERGIDDERAVHRDYGKVTFMVGNDSHTINPPEVVRFEMEVDSDRSLLGGEEDRGVTFELGWNADEVRGDDEFRVE